jgi:hypothetical protein
MAIEMTCTCGLTYTVDDDMAGRITHCTGCGKALQVPPPGFDPSSSQVRLILHQDTVFEDDNIYLVGHAYYKCQFVRCRIVLRNGSSALQECGFVSCTWSIDLDLYDVRSLQILLAILPVIQGSLGGGATQYPGYRAPDTPPSPPEPHPVPSSPRPDEPA